MFKAVPSLGNRYEIDELGNFRDYFSKKIYQHGIHYNGTHRVNVKIHGKKSSRRVNDLLLECFGTQRKEFARRSFVNPQWIPVTLSNKNVSKKFPSIQQAVNFLLSVTNYAELSLKNMLHQRFDSIADWKITYHKGV